MNNETLENEITFYKVLKNMKFQICGEGNTEKKIFLIKNQSYWWRYRLFNDF